MSAIPSRIDQLIDDLNLLEKTQFDWDEDQQLALMRTCVLRGVDASQVLRRRDELAQGLSPQPARSNAIRDAAYFRFVARNERGIPGNSETDWLGAENDLRSRTGPGC